MPNGLIFDRSLQQWHLAISECILTQQPAVINTVLGSCVAVTFLHKPSRLAAIFHAMLPTYSGHGPRGNQPCKYVDTAIERIVARYRERDIRPKELVVKLFGGSFSLGKKADYKTRAMIDVGGQNVDMAEKELRRHGCFIHSRDTRGNNGRKIFFVTPTGDVWVKQLGTISGEFFSQALGEKTVLPQPPAQDNTVVIK